MIATYNVGVDYQCQSLALLFPEPQVNHISQLLMHVLQPRFEQSGALSSNIVSPHLHLPIATRTPNCK